MLYQYGLSGIILIMILFLKILFKFFKSNFSYVYLLRIFFFIAGIKTELIFTHNQFVFFICFIFYCFFAENKAIEN